MNRQQKHPQLAVRNAASRKALQRLDEALERNTRSFSAKTMNLKLQQIRRRLFGDPVDGVTGPERPETPE